MGNVCCGAKEPSKPGVLSSNPDSSVTDTGSTSDGTSRAAKRDVDSKNAQPTDSSSQQNPSQQSQQQSELTPVEDPGHLARQNAARAEEQRLQQILHAAGRGMVSVRSTRGSTAYYDQGFAAALYQHLESTAKFPEKLPTPLPKAASTDVYSRLCQPAWENCSSGEPTDRFMDRQAAAFLEQIKSPSQQVFAGCPAMVENLL